MKFDEKEGIGKKNKKRTSIIEIKKRPENMGLSFNGFDERTDQSKKDFDEENMIDSNQNNISLIKF